MCIASTSVVVLGELLYLLLLLLILMCQPLMFGHEDDWIRYCCSTSVSSVLVFITYSVPTT